MRQLDVYLPFFCGFYESVFYNCDTEYVEFKEYIRDAKDNGRSVTEDNLNFRFNDYCNDCVDAFVKAFNNYLPDWVKPIETGYEIARPKEYNFSTDEISAIVTLNDGWENELKSYLADNKDSIAERIRKEFTSYDGYWSFLPNDFDDFIALAFDEKERKSDVALMTLIKYHMYDSYEANKRPCDDDIIWSLEWDVLENVYAGSYIEEV